MGDSQKVSTDVCEAEFARFVETMYLDVDPAGMDDEDKAAFTNSKRRVMQAMENGSLVINENGEPVFSPSDGSSPVTFHEPTGATMIAMDQKKATHLAARGFAALADMTREVHQRFGTMKNRDLKVCQSVAVLFLA